MKSKKIIASLLIIAIMISLMPMKIFAASTLKLTITPNVTEVHPGDEITYTVKMSAVQNIAFLKFKLVIPEGLTFVEGKEVDGLQATLNAAKAEFTPATNLFIVGSSNYSSSSDTTLMTFKCSVDSTSNGNKEVTFVFDEDDAFDTSYENIPVNYTNTGSNVNVTPRPIPATGIVLNKTNISLEKGANQKLTATISPENSTDSITWKSSDETKASVDQNGNVSAISEGQATITVKTTSGKSATCTVTVTKPVCKHVNKTTVSAKEPTCTLTGNNEYKVCDDCGKAFKTDGTTETTIKAETIPALGHDFSVPKHDENQHWNECSRCNTADTKINHTGKGKYQKDNTNHWKICGCGVKVEEEAHTAGEPVKENIKVACTKDGSHDEVIYCSVCNKELSRTEKVDKATGHTAGEPVKENEIEATVNKEGSYDEVVYCSECKKELSRTKKTTPKFVYEILEGAGSLYEDETSDTITIRANGKFEKFEGIKVDDKTVDKKYYTAKSDSTTVTLSADYLNTLAVGEHKIAFVYDDGEVKTTFKVTEKNTTDTTNNTQENDPSTPKTGDSSNMILWIVGITISGILFVTILRCKVKGTRKKSRH